jgi:hypothetical protein
MPCGTAAPCGAGGSPSPLLSDVDDNDGDDDACEADNNEGDDNNDDDLGEGDE